MGGRRSRVEYVQTVEYRDNPETIQALKQRAQELKKISEKFQSLQLKHDELLERLTSQYHKQVGQIKINDPKQYQQIEKKIFGQFLDGFKTFKMTSTLPKPKDIQYFAVVGEIAAGKTTIYNTILGTTEEVGCDDTTQDIAKVHQDHQKNIVYWDSPGLSQYLSITSVTCLKAFWVIDCMFIVTAVSFKNSIRTIQVMNQINPPKLYLVRNQCDKFNTDSQFQKAASKDKKLLEQYNIKNVKKILYVSMIKDDSFRDNKEFKTLMTSKF